MYTAEECRRFAEDCDRLARTATASKQRDTMLMIAWAWREIAHEREQKISEKAA